MCFDFVYNFCQKHFSFQELSDILSKMYIRLHVKYPLFLSVQWEPCCSMRTDMMKLRVAFRNFSNAPKVPVEE